jgi:hypothetical protein
MNKTLTVAFFLAAILFFTLFGTASAQKNNQPKADAKRALNALTREERNQGWELLFDGKSMSQWRNYGKDTLTGWKIQDGNMVALGEGSNDIITKEVFGNFELSLEWKTSPQGNSGIFFHVVEGKHPALYETGPEYQIIDEAGWPDKLEEWQKAAANYAMHTAPPTKKLKPVGEYNQSMIVVKTEHVEHWLNGQKVVEYQLWTPEWEKLVRDGKWKDYPDYGRARDGHLGLQDHGNVTWFRNIKVRRLK